VASRPAGAARTCASCTWCAGAVTVGQAAKAMPDEEMQAEIERDISQSWERRCASDPAAD